jgi:hypothetical protein
LNHSDRPEAEAPREADPAQAAGLPDDPGTESDSGSLIDLLSWRFRLALRLAHLRFRFRRDVRERVELALAGSRLGPNERLWRQLNYLFTDPDTYHAGPDMDLTGLSPTEVGLITRRLLRDVGSIEPSATIGIFDKDGNEVDPSEALAGNQFAPRVAEFHGRLDRVIVGTVSLPTLGFNVWADSVTMYWWVGGDADWNPEQAAAFAELIGELKALAPQARLELEWKDDERRFFRAVDAYLAATK